MSLLRRHNKVRGIRLWKWGNFQVEVWFAPAGEIIEPHVHQNIHSTIVFLAGDMVGRIQERVGVLKWPADSFRRFRVPAGTVHEARIGKFCIFANIERWSAPPTSAAEDFTAV